MEERGEIYHLKKLKKTTTTTKPADLEDAIDLKLGGNASLFDHSVEASPYGLF